MLLLGLSGLILLVGVGAYAWAMMVSHHGVMAAQELWRPDGVWDETVRSDLTSPEIRAAYAELMAAAAREHQLRRQLNEAVVPVNRLMSDLIHMGELTSDLANVTGIGPHLIRPRVKGYRRAAARPGGASPYPAITGDHDPDG